ncbi:Hypothetical protein PHPALM_14788 [Phytophthora palmivora]|uniref:3'-5' exonuclease domain-containing protein n=1 Tax=Phytophthora palmivora TaxID=4796 RepID=A0A2P4XTW8_9STRA|nr:Hypothetical protein PHPALM_14788 [Phytophthora palmivora]
MLNGDQFPVLPSKFGVEALKFDVVIDWLNALVADPAPLLAFLQETTSNGRTLALGVYFSTLLEFWLRFCPHLGIEKMDIGKQIVSSTNRTVGQLKFLFRCNFHRLEENSEKQRDFHVESSVKFFLLSPLSSDANTGAVVNADGRTTAVPLEQYVGPHLGENLAWRVQEVNRKLAMRRGESVRTWLEENYSTNVESHIVLRGYLFEPLSSFTSTSETTVGHDWHFHRNPAKMTQDTDELKTLLNSSIAPDHLRGWWTFNVKQDLPVKVRANGQAMGESRFVILPKLHWLCPVIAMEDKDVIIVDGDTRLEIPEVEALTLNELLVFAEEHFQKGTSPVETNKNGGVAMPLLVAEIVRLPHVGFAIEDTPQYWHELSRGFILDPNCWDPSPLCHEPVRFRRTLRKNVTTGNGEREYEVRRTDCAEDGFIKPDEGEAAAKEDKRHKFTDPASVNPKDLCQELLSVLSAKEMLYTHADLKRSTRELFLWRNHTSLHYRDEVKYLRSCLETLIFDINGDDESKHARRVGYLLLDVFDGLNREYGLNETNTSSPHQWSDWVELLAEVVRDSNRWEFLNLVLRAIDLVSNTVDEIKWCDPDKSSRFSILDKLLAARNIRWNAVVVEMIRVLRIGEFVPGQLIFKSKEDARKIHDIFAAFVDQYDWQSAERLATVVPDRDMMATLFKHLSLLNMTKAMKRLQKVVRMQSSTAEYALISAEESSDPMATNGLPPHLLGHPIDHANNVSLYKRFMFQLKWKYIDSLEGIEEVIRHLKIRESIIHAEDQHDELKVVQNMLVGIDCEWRPQLLVKEQDPVSINVSRSEDSTQSKSLNNQDLARLSIYQLAVGEIVYVIDVHVLGAAAAAPLSFVWRTSSRLMLIGFCVSSDIQRIKNSFPELEALFERRNGETKHRFAPLLLELKDLALFRHIPAKNWGLSRLYHACIGEELDKEQQCSDWGIRPLSSRQLEYAAKDAYAAQRLSLHLLADVCLVRTWAESCSINECVRDFLYRFDASHNGSLSQSWMMSSVSQPLGKQHVEVALQALGLEARFLKCDERQHEGLLVKSIALLIRREKQVNTPRHITYAVAVLPLDRSIDMKALGNVLGADECDISLADQEVLCIF